MLSKSDFSRFVSNETIKNATTIDTLRTKWSVVFGKNGVKEFDSLVVEATNLPISNSQYIEIEALFFINERLAGRRLTPIEIEESVLKDYILPTNYACLSSETNDLEYFIFELKHSQYLTNIIKTIVCCRQKRFDNLTEIPFA